MNKIQAQNLIKETFENPFDKVRFNTFIRNLLNRIDDSPFSYQGCYIPDAFSSNISGYERIGKYLNGENRVDILVVRLRKESSIERARTMQRNFIAGYLAGKYGSDMRKEAALVAFVSPSEVDWRFSLVKLDYRFEEGKKGRMNVVEEYTPARRWSFLVGTNEASHTAQSKLMPIMMNDVQYPTLARLEEAFNVEKVSKEFFEKYRELFIWTKDELDKVMKNDSKARKDFESKEVDSVNFAKKLLGQIVFLYFLQKKGWFGVNRDAEWGTGSKQYLRELFRKKHSKYDNFFNDILEPLFYESLARERDDNFYSRFNCKIPFLNGGLFDPMNNYDWVHTDILLPNDLFSNNKRTKEGDIGNGILDIFDRYNFTVKEDEPLDKEVAIDPEMLGKAYEKFNAIRPDNYGEYIKALKGGQKGGETKFNKQYGVYYTPREIVHYMCQQSLIQYLHSELSSVIARSEATQKSPVPTKDDIEFLIKYGEHFSENEARVVSKGKETDTYAYKLPESIRENAELIDVKLADIKVCDPAVGSGAFPVGMMTEIVKARNTLSTFLSLRGVTATKQSCTIYDFKRECIEKSLYGVDIDTGAVEIAKLRLWLSLIVDEEDIRQIKPLPNLDYKIVCGNSLLGFPDDWESQIAKEIESLKRQYFSETNPTRKNELKQTIDEKIQVRYDNSEKYLGYRVDFDFKTSFSEVFHKKSGFDSVIGNPPYVRQERLSSEFKSLMKKRYPEVACGMADIYVYFFAIGLRVTKQQGILAYITPNKYMKTKYGRDLRNLLSQYQVNKIIDFFELPVFEASNDTAITIVNKEEQTRSTQYIPVKSLEDFATIKQKQEDCLALRREDSEWIFVNHKQQRLVEKCSRNTVSLRNFVKGKIYYGVKTGRNEVFIINNSTKEEICHEDPKSSEVLKKYIRPTAIGKYTTRWLGDWLIFTRRGINISNYEGVLSYLEKSRDRLEPKPKEHKGEWFGRKPGNYKWYEIQDDIDYYQEFKKAKIIYVHTAKRHEFYLDVDGYYINNSCYFIRSDSKFLFCFLNSYMFEWLKRMKFVAYGDANTAGRCKLDCNKMKGVPIKKISVKQEKIFASLFDKIFEITKHCDYTQNELKKASVIGIEQEINNHIYRLYDLTREEIDIVEGPIK